MAFNVTYFVRYSIYKHATTDYGLKLVETNSYYTFRSSSKTSWKAKVLGDVPVTGQPQTVFGRYCSCWKRCCFWTILLGLFCNHLFRVQFCHSWRHFLRIQYLHRSTEMRIKRAKFDEGFSGNPCMWLMEFWGRPPEKQPPQPLVGAKLLHVWFEGLGGVTGLSSDGRLKISRSNIRPKQIPAKCTHTQ